MLAGIIGSFCDTGKLVQAFKSGVSAVAGGVKYAGEAASYACSKTEEVSALMDRSAEALATIASCDLKTIGGLAEASLSFSGSYDKLAEDFEAVFSGVPGECLDSVLETLSLTGVCELASSAGSIIKDESPLILGGLRDLCDGVQGLHSDSGNFIDQAVQVKSGIDRIYGAVGQIDGSLANVFTRVTTDLGINAASLQSLQSSLHSLVSSVGGQIPSSLKWAYTSLCEGVDALGAGKTMLTVLVEGFHGETTPESLERLLNTLGTSCGDFSGKLNALYRQLGGGAQSDILHHLASSGFGQWVSGVGSALKSNSPSILGGISDFRSAVEGFGGSYRDPAVAAEKIRGGAAALVRSASSVAAPVNAIIKSIQGEGGSGLPVLDTLGRLSETEPVKSMLTVADIGAEGLLGYGNVTEAVESLKRGDMSGASAKFGAAAKNMEAILAKLGGEGQQAQQPADTSGGSGRDDAVSSGGSAASGAAGSSGSGNAGGKTSGSSGGSGRAGGKGNEKGQPTDSGKGDKGGKDSGDEISIAKNRQTGIGTGRVTVGAKDCEKEEYTRWRN